MKKFSLFSLSVCLLLTTGYSCKKNSKQIAPVKKQTISFTKEGSLQLVKSDSTVLTTLDIEIADNDYETQTGLMYRTSMENNQGMLFVFPDERYHSFYMKNTEIPLDIIFIGADKKIVHIAKNNAPRSETSIPSNLPAQYVLEVNAGLSQSWDLETGDSISYTKL